MKINIFNYTDKDITCETKTLNKVFKKIKDKKSMQVILCDDKYIHELNLKYRNIDRPTDVLSFIDDIDDKTCGDIFISLNKVLQQAKDFSHSYERELSFLAIHGYLHLNGYDHIKEDEEKIMMDKTEEILKLSKLERKYYDWNN